MKRSLVPKIRILFIVSVLLVLFSCAKLPPPQPLDCFFSTSKLCVTFKRDPLSFTFIEIATGRILIQDLSFSAVIGQSTIETLLDSAQIDSDAVTNSVLITDRLHGATGKFDLSEGEQGAVSLRISLPSASRLAASYRDTGESYYGVWEQSFGNGLDNRGLSQEFLHTEGKFQSLAANARAPFFMTSKFYGVYVPTQARGRFTFGVSYRTRIEFNAHVLPLTIYPGKNYKEILALYNKDAGPSRIPPEWALGPLFWRNDLNLNLRGAANAQENLLRDIKILKDKKIPVTAMWIDRPYGTNDWGWGDLNFSENFPSPDLMVKKAMKQDVRLMLWIANRAAGSLYKEGSEKGVLFPSKSELDRPAIDIRTVQGQQFFNASLEKLLMYGFRGFKIDRGDEDEMPKSFANTLASLLPKVAASGLKKRYKEDYFILSRNANDTARKYTGVWSGDPKATFEGLRDSLKSGLRSGLINYPLWGSDTGGYSGNPSTELFARWLALSALSPVMEVLIDRDDKVLWYDYDPTLLPLVKRFADLHVALLPFTRQALKEAATSGVPIMRPLFVEFPEDPKAENRWDQFMYGSKLLVAPILEEGETERSVYLPKGRWRNYFKPEQEFDGEQVLYIEAGLDSIPLLERIESSEP